MRSIITFCISLLFIPLYGQNADSTASDASSHKSFSTPSYPVGGNLKNMFSGSAGKQTYFSVNDNITFATDNLQMSALEREISDLESLECKALLKRDTAMLKKLWARDFTLDESSGEILTNSGNPL